MVNLKKLSENKGELLEVLNNVFLFIAKIDLEKNKVLILQNKLGTDYPYDDDRWDRHLDYYANFILEQEREMIKHRLSLKNLLNIFNAKQKVYYVTLPHLKRNNQIRWFGATVNFLIDNENEKSVYLMIHEPNENVLLKNIVDLYVYNNCDYFVYLDAKNNTYTMFGASASGTPLPPLAGNDYNGEVIKYAEDYVVPEDREMVIREMSLDTVLKRLEENEVHTFMAGVIEPKGYARKKCTYRYYNKKNKIILLTRTDITNIYRQEQEYRKNLENVLEKAQRDCMTGLLNVQGIQEKINHALSNLRENEFSALMFIDLDNFKTINDTLGHGKGDEVLCRIAKVLLDETRGDDIVGRLGGDEFLVFLKNIKSIKNSEMCADRFRRRVEKISEELGIDIPTSCSIGVVFVPNDGLDYKTLVEKADRLVYSAKHQGKNRFSLEKF